MELQLKNRLLLLTAISLTIVSCEKDFDYTSPEHSVNQRYSQSMVWNEAYSYQEIIVKSDEYSILFMGDSHVGTTENLKKFINIAKSSGASAVAMAGDLTTTGSEEEYNLLKQCLPQTDSLFSFLTVGNHDLWSNNGWQEFYTLFGPSCYLFNVKSPVANDLYICLDTGSGTLGTEQFEWFENILQNQRQDYRRCIVFTHNNFIRFRHSLISNPQIEELNKLIELFTRYHVDMLITGHDHEKNTDSFGITTYVVMEPLKDGVDNAGYLELRIKNGNTLFSFENFN